MGDVQASDSHYSEDDRLGAAMSAAIDASVDAILQSVSARDLEIMHKLLHQRISDEEIPHDPILLAIYRAFFPWGDAPWFAIREAQGVHRDPLMLVAAFELSTSPEWLEQGEMLRVALSHYGYPEALGDDGTDVPSLYVGRLLERSMG